MKKFLRAFVILSICIVFIPLLGMTIRPTTTTTENKTMASFPTLTTKEGKVNLAFFQQFEKYFSEHFAFRNELVFMDSKIQSDIFGVSSMDSVISGKDGWLYYKSTLGDYLGRERMNERQLYNVAHNLSLVKEYLETKGKKFLVVFPPNKNTLYGENMPYYHNYIVEKTHNIEDMPELLEREGILYGDLLELFRNEEEVLYLKRDSHWNNKGALMAYNLMMDKIGMNHDDYSSISPNRTQDELGDLNKMLYTFYGDKELNYRYDLEEKAKYLGDYKSVEDGFIETEGGTGSETLLMFRDSFGNTLIPFIKEQYSRAWFTKEMPYGLEKLTDEYNPHHVIFEKVERNLKDFISRPPVITAPLEETHGLTTSEPAEEMATINFGSLESDFDYYQIGGEVLPGVLSEEDDILVEINGKVYRAFHIGTDGFQMYIKKTSLEHFPISVKIILSHDGEKRIIAENIFNEGDASI